MEEGDRGEGLYRQALDALPFPACIIAPDGAVLFSNRAMDRAFGPGKPAPVLPEDARAIAGKAQTTGKKVRTTVTVTVSGDRVVRFPVEAIPLSGPATGNRAPVLLTAFLTGEEDPLRELLVRDTSRKKLRELLSTIRHDILNQLTILIGFLQYSEDLYDDPQIREFIEKEENAGKSIQSLIEFTRKFQDLAIQEPAWIDLSLLVNPVEVQNLPRDVRFTIDCDHFEVFSTPLLASVFSILVENALDHATGLSRITITAAAEGDDLVIAVEDDGPGIPPGEKKMLFERGHGRHGGYSLWLAREIVGICGGAIRECGGEGRGARFEIRIPRGMWHKKDEAAA
ncbi:MAG: PAS domain-containing sensor histidine kinase [Methanolinea sp.]|nr:PAS domain-containing sensor histidine kinase [Methanolinea sp.]